eukprot:7075-Chlamydomonas_euryale.AAC.1
MADSANAPDDPDGTLARVRALQQRLQVIAHRLANRPSVDSALGRGVNREVHSHAASPPTHTHARAHANAPPSVSPTQSHASPVPAYQGPFAPQTYDHQRDSVGSEGVGFDSTLQTSHANLPSGVPANTVSAPQSTEDEVAAIRAQLNELLAALPAQADG